MQEGLHEITQIRSSVDCAGRWPSSSQHASSRDCIGDIWIARALAAESPVQSRVASTDSA
jgi:hypothetical protein